VRVCLCALLLQCDPFCQFLCSHLVGSLLVLLVQKKRLIIIMMMMIRCIMQYNSNMSFILHSLLSQSPPLENEKYISLNLEKAWRNKTKEQPLKWLALCLWACHNPIILCVVHRFWNPNSPGFGSSTPANLRLCFVCIFPMWLSFNWNTQLKIRQWT